MAVNVNPPPQLKIPKKFLADPETRGYFDQGNVILFQLWQRTGGNVDLIAELGNATIVFNSKINKNAARINSAELDIDDLKVNSENSRINRNSARVYELEEKIFEVVSVTANYTTSGNQILVCTNVAAIQITLATDAVEGDELHIKRRGEEIEEIGTIDGLTNRTINVPQWSDHLVFDGTDWSVI